MTAKPDWIWQRPDWPFLTYNAHQVAAALANAHRMHGMVEGKAASIGLLSASEVMLDAFSDATAIFSLSSLDGVQAQHQRHRMLR